MGRNFYTLDDFNVAGSTVLLRVDINSPIDPSTGRILNDARVREHLDTIRDLANTRLAILAHQSRPGKDDFTTLEAHAERMSALLGRPVAYVDSLFGRHAVEAIRGMKVGDIVLLENTRFFAEEEALADAKFEKMAKAMMVRKLAPLAQYFVLDAFAAAPRAPAEPLWLRGGPPRPRGTRDGAGDPDAHEGNGESGSPEGRDLRRSQGGRLDRRDPPHARERHRRPGPHDGRRREPVPPLERDQPWAGARGSPLAGDVEPRRAGRAVQGDPLEVPGAGG